METLLVSISQLTQLPCYSVWRQCWEYSNQIYWLVYWLTGVQFGLKCTRAQIMRTATMSQKQKQRRCMWGCSRKTESCKPGYTLVSVNCIHYRAERGYRPILQKEKNKNSKKQPICVISRKDLTWGLLCKHTHTHTVHYLVFANPAPDASTV